MADMFAKRTLSGYFKSRMPSMATATLPDRFDRMRKYLGMQEVFSSTFFTLPSWIRKLSNLNIVPFLCVADAKYSAAFDNTDFKFHKLLNP